MDDLQARELALASEVEQLRHELRRVRDGLERAGGRDRTLESQARQLTDNIRICEQELQQISQQIKVTSR